MTTAERLECFKTELNYIKHPGLRRFAELLLENADEYFFVVPASSGGKYHPDFARKKSGGLVLHTKAVTDILHMLLEEQELWGLTDDQKDMMYIAAITHDIKKQGNGAGHHTIKEHPMCAATYVNDVYNAHSEELLAANVTPAKSNVIQLLIQSHMGKWAVKDGMPAPKTTGQFLLCTADYMASRKEWNQTFTGEPQLIQEMLQSETLVN